MQFTLAQITFEEFAQAKAALKAALAQGDTVLDFSQVERVDSTAVALILFARREALRAQRPLKLVGMPESFDELVKLYGLEELFTEAVPTLSTTHS